MGAGKTRILTSVNNVPRTSARTLLPLARLVRRMLDASQEETSHAHPTAFCSPVSKPVDAAAPGAPAVAQGTDFGVIAHDGRLNAVTGFLN